MSRQWKPGDVAVLSSMDGVRYLALRTDSARWAMHMADVYDGSALAESARPVVVIDPGDREQVEHLAGLIARNGKVDEPFPGAWPDKVQAALRSLAILPSPPEPTGLGAVVDDSEGREWVHFGNGCWIKSVPNAQMEQREWSQITAARILSEGVTP